MQKTLFVTDLDGTLLNPKGELSDFTIATINDLIDRGGLFSFATARSYVSAKPRVRDLNLNLPVSVFGGAFLADPQSGARLEGCILDRKEIGLLLEGMEQSQQTPLVYSLQNGRERVSFLTNHDNLGVQGYLIERSGDARLKPCRSYEELFEGDIFYFTLIGTREEMLAAAALVEGNGYYFYHVSKDNYTQDYWMEVQRFDASKAYSVQKLKKISGAERLICFGDNYNDIPMLEVADVSYAVKNAPDDVRAAASGVIENCDNDGVARFIANWMTMQG